MDRQHKIWGERWLIRQDSTHATAFLKMKKGFRCSWHRHQTKYNLFVVLYGKVGIITEELEGIKRESILTEGNCFITRPGQWHEFRVYENSGMIEEMYVEYNEADIERKILGGVYYDIDWT
jgi:mannose-6-phosphate isomerase-like protein (cupin superfamily)